MTKKNYLVTVKVDDRTFDATYENFPGGESKVREKAKEDYAELEDTFPEYVEIVSVKEIAPGNKLA